MQDIQTLMIDDYQRGRRPLTWADLRGPLPNSAIVLADSIGLYSEVVLTASALTNNGDGTATVTISAGHASCVGTPVRLGATTAKKTNAMDAVITAVASSTVFTCALAGRTHSATGAGPGNVAFPQRRSSKGFVTAYETLRGKQFDTITWCTVGGGTAAHVHELARVSNPGPYSVAFVCVGMNNVYSVDQSFATAWAEIEALLTFARDVARYVVVVSIPPRDSGGAFWSSDKQTVHNQLNRRMHLECMRYGLIWINSWRATWGGVSYVNGGATNPDPTAAMTADGTHPSMPGAYAMAAAIDAKLTPLIDLDGYLAAHASMIGADAGNILTDSNFSGGTTAPTNWGITNVTSGASVTGSMENRTVAADGDAFGRNALATFNYGSASGQASFRYTRSSSLHASLTAGKKFKAYIPFSIKNGLDIQGFDLVIGGTMSGGQSWFVQGNLVDSNTDGFAGDVEGLIETVESVIPSGISACQPYVRVLFGSGQTSDAEFRWWHPVFRVYD